VTYSFRKLKLHLFLLYFKCYTFSVSNAMVSACSEGCGCTFWRGPNLSNDMKVEAGHKPCHLPCSGGLVSPIGDETTVGLEFVPKIMLCFSAVKKACLRARSKPLPKEWLGSSDRAYQRLSTGVEKSRHTRCFRACAPENRFAGCCWKQLKVPQHDCIIPNGASASASGARCS
jgi:hypothetical protein